MLFRCGTVVGSHIGANMEHLRNMMNIAVLTAQSLYRPTTAAVYTNLSPWSTGNPANNNNNNNNKPPPPTNQQEWARHDGLASHLAIHMTERTVEWIQDEILKSASYRSSNDETTSSKGNANDMTAVLACCLVWNQIVETNSDLARFVVRAVGHILNQVYEDKTEAMIARANVADALVVNLTVLLERVVCIGLQRQQGQQQQTSPLREEVASALGPTLTTPIPICDMPSFLLQATTLSKNNLSPASKMMMRLSLYDLLVKLFSI